MTQIRAVYSRVIGGAMLPHAPQFFTMPETEDRDTVERVSAVGAQIGAALKALTPDLWIIFSNDHAEQFFHQAAPPFTIHVGNVAEGEFAGRSFHWKVPGEIGFALIRELYRQGFDPAFSSTAKIDYAMGIPLTHLHVEDPVLPIYVKCLSAAAAADGALLRLWPGGRADRHRHGSEDRGRCQRRHVAFPWHRTLLSARPRLGQRVARQARGRKFEIPDRLGRRCARPNRQCRVALLGGSGRRAGRAQAGHRLNGTELAPQLRVARILHAARRRARSSLSLDHAGTGRIDDRTSRLGA